MKIDSVETAFDQLADAVWWFEGFAAARPPSIDEGSGKHLILRDQCNELRRWIYGLVRGDTRRIAFRDDERILITLAEFEAMRDGLRGFCGTDEDNRNTMLDRIAGEAVAHRIHREYRTEEQAANDPHVPF